MPGKNLEFDSKQMILQKQSKKNFLENNNQENVSSAYLNKNILSWTQEIILEISIKM